MLQLLLLRPAMQLVRSFFLVPNLRMGIRALMQCLLSVYSNESCFYAVS